MPLCFLSANWNAALWALTYRRFESDVTLDAEGFPSSVVVPGGPGFSCPLSVNPSEREEVAFRS